MGSGPRGPPTTAFRTSDDSLPQMPSRLSLRNQGAPGMRLGTFRSPVPQVPCGRTSVVRVGWSFLPCGLSGDYVFLSLIICLPLNKLNSTKFEVGRLHIYRIFLDWICRRFFFLISFFSKNQVWYLFIIFTAFMFSNLFVCFYLYDFLSPVSSGFVLFLEIWGWKAHLFMFPRCVQVGLGQ